MTSHPRHPVLAAARTVAGRFTSDNLPTPTVQTQRVTSKGETAAGVDRISDGVQRSDLRNRRHF